MRDERKARKANELLPGSLKSQVYGIIHQKGTGGFMTTSSKRNAARAEIIRDVLMVSSFGFWALVLGLAPVLAIGMLTAS
jgi:hypothetical protein